MDDIPPVVRASPDVVQAGGPQWAFDQSKVPPHFAFAMDEVLPPHRDVGGCAAARTDGNSALVELSNSLHCQSRDLRRRGNPTKQPESKRKQPQLFEYLGCSTGCWLPRSIRRVYRTNWQRYRTRQHDRLQDGNSSSSAEMEDMAHCALCDDAACFERSFAMMHQISCQPRCNPQVHR